MRMRIVEQYSHLNGYEHILIHKPHIWTDIVDVIGLVDAETFRTNVSTEDGMSGKSLISHEELNRRFDQEFSALGWRETRTSSNQTDFVKDRIVVEAQFGRYSLTAYDLLVKHMAFYVGDVIDVGVEILPMKEMSSKEMSSGVLYYDGELYNVIRQGRGVPAVPLVLIGVAP